MIYLLVSHDISVVENNSDHIATRISASQIVEMGTRDQIFSNPRHPYRRVSRASTGISQALCADWATNLSNSCFMMSAMGTSSPLRNARHCRRTLRLEHTLDVVIPGIVNRTRPGIFNH